MIQPGTIEDAIEIALRVHAGQTDKSGEPYILHPLTVMYWAADSGLSEDAIKAAVMHDVPEDSAKNPNVETITVDDIKVRFGERCGRLVDAMTQKPGQSRRDYILQIGPLGGWEGVRLKHIDHRHNTLPKRLAKLPEDDQRRLRAKYEEDRSLLDTWCLQNADLLYADSARIEAMDR